MINYLNRFVTHCVDIRSKLTSKKMSAIKTFVFIDLETTGLPQFECNSTRTTELCAVAVQADHIELGCFPRVQNKLTICLNPNKLISLEATNITGLSNDLLEHQTSFTVEVVQTLKNWMKLNQEPICIVAHNGDRFDYPILKADIHKTGESFLEDVLCVDSLTAFRHLDNEESSKDVEKSGSPFDDGLDEVLCQIAAEFDKKGEPLTPAEMQRRNETTPKKQVIASVSSESLTVKKKLFKTKVSYKLGEVYKRLTQKEPIGAHAADADVNMLIMCCAVYGEKFVDYANKEAKKFSDIPMMTPFKKIGS